MAAVQEDDYTRVCLLDYSEFNRYLLINCHWV